MSFLPFVSPLRRVSSSYIGLVSNVGDQNSYTFSGVNIGSPGLVVLAIYGSSPAYLLNSVTIGGVAANILAATNLGTGSTSVLAWLRVPSGATQNIVVNWSGQMKRCAVAVFNIAGNAHDAPRSVYAVTPAAVTSQSITLSIPGGAAAIFASAADTSTSYTWTGVAEDYDAHIDTTGTMTVSGAHISKYSGPSPLTISVNVGASGNDLTLVEAVWT